MAGGGVWLGGEAVAPPSQRTRADVWSREQAVAAVAYTMSTQGFLFPREHSSCFLKHIGSS